jgi:DNA-binding response OmpR family regulator
MAVRKDINWTHARAHIPVLVVCANGTTSNQVRQAVKTIGFNSVTAAAGLVPALDRIRGRDFALVLFDAKSSDMPTNDFVKQVINLDPNIILIAVSAEPRVDDVFGLLRDGARSFLCLPFTVDIMEAIIMRATQGRPMSEAVLNAPDRNAALVGVVLNHVYKTSVLMRQSREFPSAAKDRERQQYALVESMDMARLFCEGGDDSLLEKIIEGCVGRANIAATKLGRTRKKLQKERAQETAVGG